MNDLRTLAEKATPGPWGWFGHVNGVYLATVDRGRVFVMRFQRRGFQGAEPMFQVHDDPEHPMWGRMVGAAKLAVREVPYRDDITAIDNPDAAYIAAASPDVILALLDRIDELEARAAFRDAE